MIVVDTDILIEFLRGNEDIKNKFNSFIHQNRRILYLTPIQIAEIYAGIRDNEKPSTEKFLNSFQIIEIDRGIGKQAGVYLNIYRKSHGVELADTLIGASAKKYEFNLWTLNKKHYPMFLKDEFIH
jgi:hypothetical protein